MAAEPGVITTAPEDVTIAPMEGARPIGMTVKILRQLLDDVDGETGVQLSDGTPVRGLELSAAFNSFGEKTRCVIMLEV